MIHVLTLGEILIDLVATRSGVALFDAPAFEPKPGGAPANVAIGVQRLGKQAAFVGKVGRDEMGQGLRHLLEREGVLTTGLWDDDAMTTLALVSLSADGDPHFAFAPGAHTRLLPGDVADDLLRDTLFFSCGSVSLAQEPVRGTTLDALTRAHEMGVICAYDVNWRPFLWLDAANGLLLAAQPLATVDICKMNGAELRLLTGEADPERGLAIIAPSAALVVITLGKLGCLYRFAGKITHQAVPIVEHVVDATGAGDAFMAALLASLPGHPREMSPEAIGQIVRRACFAGALAVTARGAITALPTAAALEQALAQSDATTPQ